MSAPIVRSIILGLMCAVLLQLGACSDGAGRQQKYLARAQLFFDAGDFDKSRVEVKNALQINGNHADGRYLLALLHEQEGNWQQMFANLNLVVDIDHDHIPARVKLAQMLLANQYYDETLEQIDAVLALDPENLDAHALHATVHYHTGDRVNAIEEAEYVLQRQSGHVAAISVLALVYGEEDPERALAVVRDGLRHQVGDETLRLVEIGLLESSQRDEAVKVAYRALIADFPENLLYQYRFVLYLEKTAKVDEAEAVLRDVVETKPDNVELKLWLAQFLVNNRNPELAEKTLKEFIAKEPTVYKLRFGLGKLYAGLGKYRLASDVYLEVVALDEKGADGLLARNSLVELAIQNNDQATAAGLLKDIFAIEAENREALITRGRLSLGKNDTKSAISDFRTVLRNDPISTTALKLLAAAHEADGVLNLALDNYRQVLQLEPTDDDAAYNAARLALASGEWESAEHLLSLLSQRQPDNVDVARMLVTTYASQRRWPEALSKAARLIARDDTAGLGYYLKGRVYFDQDDFGSAVGAFEQALKLKPAAVEALEFLVRARQHGGEIDQAHQYLLQHTARYPEQVHAFELLAAVQRQLGDLVGATASYEKAIALAPQNSTAYQRLASLHAAQARWPLAIATYERGMAANPQNARLYAGLAGLELRQGDIDTAIALYEKALKIDPLDALAANDLAATLVDYRPTKANLKRALALTEALLVSNRNSAVLDTLGWIHYKLGNTSQALSLLTEAVAAGGKGAVYHYHLGMAYHSDGQQALAREQLELSLGGAGDNFSGRQEAELTLASLR